MWAENPTAGVLVVVITEKQLCCGDGDYCGAYSTEIQQVSGGIKVRTER